MISSIVTGRLALRPLDVGDLELLGELNGDPVVMEFISGTPGSLAETAIELEAAVGTRWLAFARGEGTFLGWVGAVPTDDGAEYDVGWRFMRSAWGRGYATEAARALIDRLFEDGAQRVFAQTMAVNVRSRAVMERLGLRHCRTFHLEASDPLPGTELGEVEYELTLTEWMKGHQ